jgi:hypothetical protein
MVTEFAWRKRGNAQKITVAVPGHWIWIRIRNLPNTNLSTARFVENTVARMWRLYKTGIGLTTGFIG